MRIAVGVDHAGFPLKQTIVSALEGAGHEVIDCGTDSDESVDYPVHAARAAALVSRAARPICAVLACGSGAGVSIVANKFPGVRAVNARDPEDAEMARRHNDANVLALAGRRLEPRTRRAGDRPGVSRRPRSRAAATSGASTRSPDSRSGRRPVARLPAPEGGN